VITAKQQQDSSRVKGLTYHSIRNALDSLIALCGIFLSTWAYVGINHPEVKWIVKKSINIMNCSKVDAYPSDS
jgi:hypothetical protein